MREFGNWTFLMAFKITHPLTYTFCLADNLVTRVTGTVEASRSVDTQLSAAMGTVTLVGICMRRLITCQLYNSKS